jgi:hypothetical protein
MSTMRDGNARYLNVAIDVHRLNGAKLFAGPYVAGTLGRTYDVSADGQRFLMIKNNAGVQTSTPASRVPTGSRS